jgi:hypothetical protein
LRLLKLCDANQTIDSSFANQTDNPPAPLPRWNSKTAAASLRRFDWPAFLRALETGQTNRLERTYAVAHSTGVLKPRSTAPPFVYTTPGLLRSAPGFRTPVQCFGICTPVREF